MTAPIPGGATRSGTPARTQASATSGVERAPNSIRIPACPSLLPVTLPDGTGQSRVPDGASRRRPATGSGRVAGASVTWSWSEVSTRRSRAPTATVARQPAHSRPIQTAAAPAAIRPVASAGQMMNARDWERAASELARPRSLSSVRRLTSGLTVGASTVSPSPNKCSEAEHESNSPGGRDRQRGEAEHRPGGGEDQPADGKGAASPGAADAAQHEQLGEHDEGGVDGERQGYDTRRHVRFD